MKKSIVFVAVLAVIVAVCGSLAGCGSSVAQKGTAWSRREVITYNITESGNAVGTQTVELTKLSKGDEVEIAEIGKSFTIEENFGNAKIVSKTVDVNGKVIEESVCLMQGCGSLASYKKVSYGDTNVIFRGYYSGKNLYFATDAETPVDDFEKTKIASGYMDNQALYFALRCQDLDAGFSGSYTMVDMRSGNTEKISVASSTAEQYALPLEVRYTNKSGEALSRVETCVAVSVAKSEAPKGSAIMLYYTPYDITKAEGFDIVNNKNDAASSFHFPVRIEENNLTYDVANICVNID